MDEKTAHGTITTQITAGGGENEQEFAGFLTTVTPPLYCMLHRAQSSRDGQPANRGVVIFVPPFAEEKKAAMRAMVEAARHFAASGFIVLRFDFRGTGDSGGEFGESTVAMWRDDLRAVLEQARALTGDSPIYLVGLRLGAALAWLAAQKNDNIKVDGLVLWEPIISGATYMRQNRQRSQIRRELTNEMKVDSATEVAPTPMATDSAEFPAFDFDGFAISSILHREIVQIDLLTENPPAVKRLLLLQISGSSRIRKPLQDLETHARAAGIDIELENIAVEAFWSSIGLVDTTPVRERTLQWLLNESASNEQASPTKDHSAPPLDFSDTALISPTPPVAAEPFSFVSGEQRIHGVLYHPVDERTQKLPVERAVVLLHGWSGYRSGPGHLLTEAARALAAAGHAACSFDFRGRGESEWEVGEASLNSMIRDACRAVPIVIDRTGASKVSLLGLCSGAEVAIGASLSYPRIDSLALWSAPIFSGNFTTARQLRRSRDTASKYWQKLFRGETWSKLFAGRINFKMVFRALSGGRSSEDANVVEKAPDTAGQMQEFAAFSGRLLFIYGSNDPETIPSRDFYREFVERTSIANEFHEITGANHNYYREAWKRQVIELTLNWLEPTSTASPHNFTGSFHEDNQ